MATVRPKGEGAWEVRVYVGFDRRGRPRQVSRMYRGPKRGLNRFVADLEKQFDEVGVDGATATVGQLLDRGSPSTPSGRPTRFATTAIAPQPSRPTGWARFASFGSA